MHHPSTQKLLQDRLIHRNNNKMGAGASINGADADEATELEAIAAMIEVSKT